MKNSHELIDLAIAGDAEAAAGLRARIDELEKAVGGAFLAMLLNMLRDGHNPADASENSAFVLVANAAGIEKKCTVDGLTSFQQAYFERFAPKGGEA